MDGRNGQNETRSTRSKCRGKAWYAEKEEQQEMDIDIMDILMLRDASSMLEASAVLQGSRPEDVTTGKVQARLHAQ